MLFLIGTGLANATDISRKGLEAIQNSDKVYLENYTSKLQDTIEELEAFYEIEITPLNREEVEQVAKFTEEADEKDVALLIMGDIFSATTHFEIYKDAVEKGIEVEVIHNASILTAVSITGLQLYKFGRTASIPFHNENVTTPKDILKANKEQGLHTLFLLDLSPEEDKFMTVRDALNYLDYEGQCIGCARLGSKDFKVKAGKAEDLKKEDFGKPPHCVIIPGNMHFTEEEALKFWS